MTRTRIAWLRLQILVAMVLGAQADVFAARKARILKQLTEDQSWDG